MVMRKPANAEEIFEYLRARLEIPQRVKELTLHLRMRGLPEIECTYYPEDKEAKED